MFSCEYCEMFNTAFFIEHLLFIIPFRNHDDRTLWNFLVAKLIHVIFLVSLLFSIHNSSVRIGSALPFLIYSVFILKFLVSVTFAHITTTAPSLFWNNNSRIIAATPGNLLRKMWIWVFLILCCVVIFFLEAVLQGMARSSPAENKSIQKFKRHWNMRQCEN